MSGTLRASSEAIFGSAARGDSDALSDRDILIVDTDTNVLRARATALTNDGWSVASYTFAKLEALASRGALFIQHLKFESRILEDREGRLHRILASFRPKSDYTQELADNTLLAALAAGVPRGRGGALLAADILYVAVRNFGVLRLAERGIHTYSFSSIIEALTSVRLISKEATASLAALRFLKCVYRSGERSHGTHTLDVLNAALSTLPSSHFPSVILPKDPLSVIQDEPPREASSAYILLRDMERRLVALEAIKPSCTVGEELTRLRSWTENPRAYASFAAKAAPRIRSAIQNACRAHTLHAAQL